MISYGFLTVRTKYKQKITFGYATLLLAACRALMAHVFASSGKPWANMKQPSGTPPRVADAGVGLGNLGWYLRPIILVHQLLMVYASWLIARGSCLKARGSRLVALTKLALILCRIIQSISRQKSNTFGMNIIVVGLEISKLEYLGIWTF